MICTFFSCVTGFWRKIDKVFIVIVFFFFFFFVSLVSSGGERSGYLLEFGRSVDLATFQRGFTAARGYFRQMLTLRTLVADSFWQGFASGTGAWCKAQLDASRRGQNGQTLKNAGRDSWRERGEECLLC